jgi:hypothetical protein
MPCVLVLLREDLRRTAAPGSGVMVPIIVGGMARIVETQESRAEPGTTRGHW